MNKRLLFFTEDQAGMVGHSGLKARMFRAYAALLNRAILAEIGRRRPGVSVVSERLRESLPADAGLESANYVTALGFSKAHVAPLLAFQKALLRSLGQHAALRIRLEAAANRGILAYLLENLARPIGAYGAFFSEHPEVSELLLLETVSPHGRIAASVAKSLGWKVRVSPWRILLSPLAWLKARARQRTDGMPSVAALAAGYRHQALESGKADLAFFCVDERRIRRLAPTAQALVAKGASVEFAVFNVKAEVGKAVEGLQGTGLPVVMVNHCLPAPVSLAEAEGLCLEARALWKSAFRAMKGAPEDDLKGISISAFCQERVLGHCDKFTMEAALFERAARHYLETRRPRTVFLSDVGLHAMVMARLCSEYGIKTVFYVYNPLLFTVPYWRGILFAAVHSDFVFTGTPAMAETYRLHGGYAKDALRVVGDVFAASESAGAREALRARLGLAGEEKLVLALSFFVSADLSLSQKRHFFRTVHAAVKKLPGTRLIVKAHPNESERLLAQMLAEDGIEPALLTQNDDLRMLLNASDAVCMVFSQAGMEAVLCGAPLVIVQGSRMLKGFEDWVPYVREGAAAAAEEPVALAAELKALLFDPAARSSRLGKAAAFREKYISPIGLDASAAMVAEISAILK